MNRYTVVIGASAPPPEDWLRRVAAVCAATGVERILLLGPHAAAPGGLPVACKAIATDRPLSSATWNPLPEEIRTPALLTISADAGVEITDTTIRRFLAVLEDSGAPLVYSDHREITPDGAREHPLIDYQFGSLRDGFDFGPLMAWRTTALQQALAAHGALTESTAGALYDLRLRVSLEALPLRIPEPLYAALALDLRPTGARQFDYVDPRNQQVQQEMERIATAHLERLGARLEPRFAAPPAAGGHYPVEASVIIPVRNRERTIGEAVRSVLAQQTDFAFNVIVVDNHSTDDTTPRLAALAGGDERVVHLVPDRDDLGIGGCWDHGVRAAQAGRYVAQLDSDDLYDGPGVLQRIVDTFRSGHYAMIVGSYRLVNFELEEIPPGVIDHREWTRENGRNNLLRVNGLGAPRAFQTEILRRHMIPNVSYGEDYAIGLRISREYEIGRIYDPIYLCRRWEGNSDADLPLATKNRYDAYKDRIRTIELLARQHLVRAGQGQ